MTTGSDTVPAAGEASLPAVIQAWFDPDHLQPILATGDSQAARLAADWLARGGKRWRPLLSATVCRGLIPVDAPLPAALAFVALAAECLHKASLIHDDIEDADDQRYGRPTLHRTHGIPVALNVGDLLVGEGYRLLAACDIPACVRIELIQVAASAHRRLCLGQDRELQWRLDPRRPGLDELLDWFALKTVPAFELALLSGAITGGADEAVRQGLKDLGHALGIAYQIADDCHDLGDARPVPADAPLQPSIMLALLDETEATELDAAMAAGITHTALMEVLRAAYAKPGAADRVTALHARYANAASCALDAIPIPRLRELLTPSVEHILTAKDTIKAVLISNKRTRTPP